MTSRKLLIGWPALVMLAWSLFIGALAWWHVAGNEADFETTVHAYAKACQEKDLLFRRWVSQYGGVYAPISDICPPNEYLDAAERDITSPSGRQLTLVNPAYMIRQIHDLGQKDNGVATRVTSLKPLNPINTPDEWERAALESFEKGSKEASAVVLHDGKRVARLICPLMVEKTCLKCHGDEGYHLGDVRGGISVGVPVDVFWESAQAQTQSGLAAYGCIWLVGLAGVILVHRTLASRRRDREFTMEALRASERRLTTLMANLPGIVYRCKNDRHWTMEFISEGCLALTGYAPRALLGEAVQPYGELIHGDDRDYVWDTIQEALAQRSRFQLEYRITAADGQEKWVWEQGTGIFADNGELEAIEGVITDITDRKLALMDLERSRQTLDLAINGANLGTWDCNPTTGEMTVSPRCAAFFGFSPEEVPPLARFWTRAVHPDDFRSTMRQLQSHLQHGVEYNCEHRVRTKTGDSVWVSAMGRLVQRDAEGRPTRMIGVAQDISARKGAEEQLERAKEDALAASRAKSEFLANISHEIRTPMTAILGYLDLIGDTCTGKCGADYTEARGYREIIGKNAQLLLEIINTVLDLSKIEAGKLELHGVACSPRNLVTEVVDLLKVRAQAKGIVLSAAFKPPMPEVVFCDDVRLRQILFNLVGNAVKFTEHGEVRVVVRHALDAGRPMLTVDVADTGVGIAADKLETVFEPFAQGDVSTTRRFGGTGLGLSISRRLARLMGGDVLCASEEGKGSCFTARLAAPAVDPASVTRGEASSREFVSPAVTSLSGRRILLAEDGLDNQRLISVILRKAGAEVALADNGDAAMQAALTAWQAGQPFDAVLMDMQMPVMDGYQATGALRAAGYTGPIVALTAHALATDRDKCIEAGCDGYLTKPIHRQTLLEVVGTFCSQLASHAPS